MGDDGTSRTLSMFGANVRLKRSHIPITRAAPRSCIPGTTPGWPPTPSLPSRTTSLSISSRARATTRLSWTLSTMSFWRPRITRASSFHEVMAMISSKPYDLMLDGNCFRKISLYNEGLDIMRENVGVYLRRSIECNRCTFLSRRRDH